MDGKALMPKDIIIIRDLQINVKTPTNLPDGAKVQREWSQGLWRYALDSPSDYDWDKDEDESTGELYMHPRYLATFIEREIRRLLAMDYHHASFGAVLYERIGRIRLSIDGKLLDEAEWDLGKMLQAFPPDGPFQTFENGRQASFPEWWAKAIRLREEAGL